MAESTKEATDEGAKVTTVAEGADAGDVGELAPRAQQHDERRDEVRRLPRGRDNASAGARQLGKQRGVRRR